MGGFHRTVFNGLFWDLLLRCHDMIVELYDGNDSTVFDNKKYQNGKEEVSRQWNDLQKDFLKYCSDFHVVWEGLRKKYKETPSKSLMEILYTCYDMKRQQHVTARRGLNVQKELYNFLEMDFLGILNEWITLRSKFQSSYPEL